jgi:hypothetical protein
VGIPGAHVNLKRGRVPIGTLSAPGTGLSYRHSFSGGGGSDDGGNRVYRDEQGRFISDRVEARNLRIRAGVRLVALIGTVAVFGLIFGFKDIDTVTLILGGWLSLTITAVVGYVAISVIGFIFSIVAGVLSIFGIR